MPYEHAHQIEERLDLALALIQRERMSAAQLVASLGVSAPTVSRDIKALRARGHRIRAVREADGWHYELEAPPMRPSLVKTTPRVKAPQLARKA